MSRWIERAPVDEVDAVYADLAARVAAGMLVQPVDSTYPLEAPAHSGKILFVP